MVPPIHRPEMYAGKGDLAPNVSPVSLFDADAVTYPNIKFIEHVQHIKLQAGDCIYVPAFYFSQFAGEATP